MQAIHQLPSFQTNDAKINELLNISPEMGDSLLKSIMATYFEDSSSKLNQFKQALAINDIDSIIMISHSLKSSSASLGGDSLASVLCYIEKHAHELSGEDASILLGKVFEEYDFFVSYLNNFN